MIIQFHTPQGIVNINSDIVTDEELAALNITREDLTKLLPRDLAAEIDEIKKATGIGSAGEKGIAQRIDNLEARIVKLEV